MHTSLYRRKLILTAMMKIYIRIITILTLSLLFLSCERGELLNSEADIINVILPQSIDTLVGEPIVSNYDVRIPKSVSDSLYLAEQLRTLAPEFQLTPGASIFAVVSKEDSIFYLANYNTILIPEDSVPVKDFKRNFNTPQQYVVVSEDKKWSKRYEISFFESKFDRTSFSFENYEFAYNANRTKKYYNFYEINEQTNERQDVWSSGNSGFAMSTLPSTEPEGYPTSSTPLGKIGRGAKLQTCSTGTFGSMVNMPIAAGNLFLGQFELANATSKPMEATQFGVSTIMDEPKELTVWCKYKAGPEYKDRNGNILADIVDRPEIYAVLYEPEKDENGKPILLNGNNIRTADNIVSIAVMSEKQVEEIRVNDIEADEYAYVSIPFESRKPFLIEKQEKGLYYIAMVFSSSTKGNLFEGAIGSTLYVDEVNFITK